MVFVLNKETVSPLLNPYFRIKAVLRWVAFVFTWSQSSLSLVTALTYPARGSRDDLYRGEWSPGSKAHSHVVMSVGTGVFKF
jgi:hypothetical protein